MQLNVYDRITFHVQTFKNKNGSKFLYRYSSQLVSPRISEYVFSLRVIIKYYIGGHDAVQ